MAGTGSRCRPAAPRVRPRQARGTPGARCPVSGARCLMFRSVLRCSVRPVRERLPPGVGVHPPGRAVRPGALPGRPRRGPCAADLCRSRARCSRRRRGRRGRPRRPLSARTPLGLATATRVPPPSGRPHPPAARRTRSEPHTPRFEPQQLGPEPRRRWPRAAHPGRARHGPDAGRSRTPACGGTTAGQPDRVAARPAPSRRASSCTARTARAPESPAAPAPPEHLNHPHHPYRQSS